MAFVDLTSLRRVECSLTWRKPLRLGCMFWGFWIVFTSRYCYLLVLGWSLDRSFLNAPPIAEKRVLNSKRTRVKTAYCSWLVFDSLPPHLTVDIPQWLFHITHHPHHRSSSNMHFNLPGVDRCWLVCTSTKEAQHALMPCILYSTSD